MVKPKLPTGKKNVKASETEDTATMDEPVDDTNLPQVPKKKTKKSKKPKMEKGAASPSEIAQDELTKVDKRGMKKSKLKVRARKLYAPFMSYLKSYMTFAEELPKHFMKFDEEKLAEQKEEKEEVEEDKSDGGEDLDSEEQEMLPKIGRGPQFGSATRAKTISELRERLEKFKGKSLSYQDRLKRKGLKVRLTKKQRLEERMKLKKEKRKIQKSKGNPVKPLVNDDDEQTADTEKKKPAKEPKMIFSKLELPEEEGYKKRVNKDPKRMLQKIQKSQAKLKELEQKGRTDTVRKIKEKLTWDKAIQKAEGVKVKDDVELLKKTIKRKEGIKAHSKKKWDKRLEGIEKRKQDSQKKRAENITKKKKEKKQKKIKKSIKKGRVVL